MISSIFGLKKGNLAYGTALKFSVTLTDCNVTIRNGDMDEVSIKIE